MFFFCVLIQQSFMCLNNSHGPEGTAGPDCSCPNPGAPPTCPWPKTPCQPRRAASPYPSDATAGPVPSSSQPCPAQPRALPSQTHPWAHIPSGLSLSHPQGGAQCRVWGCFHVPQLSCSWPRWWDRHWLPGPALMGPDDPLMGQHLAPAFHAAFSRSCMLSSRTPQTKLPCMFQVKLSRGPRCSTANIRGNYLEHASKGCQLCEGQTSQRDSMISVPDIW